MGEGVTGATPTDETSRCYVGAGDGYVVRRGSRLAVIAPSGHPQSPGLVELLTTGPSDWSELVRELAGRITAADYKDVPSIGVLDTQDQTAAVFLYGDVVASLSNPVECVHLDGSRAVNWVEQSYSGGIYESVELRTSASAAFEISTDLRAGVVLGAALMLTSAPAPPSSAADPRVATIDPSVNGPNRSTGPTASAALDPPPPGELKPVSVDEPEPSPAPSAILSASADGLPSLHVDAEPEAERFTELRITSLIESPVTAVPVPLLVPDSGAPPGQLDSDNTYIVNPDRLAPRAPRVIWAQAPAPTSPVLPPGQVRGVGCPRGHPNRSTDVSCRTCGDAVDADGEPIVGPRPALGWLILDDGTTICLDLPCVIGHLPPQDQMISGELARAVTLDDQKHRISRRHLEIHLVGWEARAVDCGSTNGTRFRRAGSRRSGPLKANEPQPLRSGDELELGKRTLTFVDHLP